MMCGTNKHLHVFQKYLQVSFSGVPDSRTMRQAPPTFGDIMHKRSLYMGTDSDISSGLFMCGKIFLLMLLDVR